MAVTIIHAGWSAPCRGAMRNHPFYGVGHADAFITPISEVSCGFGAVGAIALTLLDYETSVWLGAGYDTRFANWLRFHCNCPMAADPQTASFAFLSGADLPELGLFNPGTEKYPDTAATLVIAVPD